MTFVDILKIVAAVIIPNLGSLVNGRITRDNLKPWFAGLKQPSYNPPNYLFAPVWITIYVSMGFASYLVYRDGEGLWTKKSRIPLALYVVQLALNWAWTSIFFGYHSLKWSLVEIIILDVAVVACAITFYRVNTTAGLLFIPYIAWLAYASVLNYALYSLNPDNGEASATESSNFSKEN